jgi:hypothetical protein
MTIAARLRRNAFTATGRASAAHAASQQDVSSGTDHPLPKYQFNIILIVFSQALNRRLRPVGRRHSGIAMRADEG